MNNRQNGRRRGRGGQQARNGQPGGPSNGSRLDNRARGNAAQLLEKYKNLARDAQMSGDRVNTEYYLQFADHYFRVLNENRARFEDQRAQRGVDYRDDFVGDDEGGEMGGARADQADDIWDDGENEPQQARPARAPAPRVERAAANGQEQGGERRRERSRRPVANGTPAEAPADGGDGEALPMFSPDFMSQRIEAQPDSVNPQLAEDVADVTVEEEAPKPRRRTRRPRAETVAEAEA
jgi:hypothetical protein